MKVKVSEASGPVLDWMVAKAEESKILIEDGVLGFERFKGELWGSRYIECYTPSTNWAQGGPLIEREQITVCYDITSKGTRWFSARKRIGTYGPTPLIAAMRAFVSSKLGEEVEVPDGLL